ncbi:hypothetical protein F5890DRAFT_1478721 [Lentinula detonsa]|uniref:Uncharacterized protein n=1 Tax=Lentinula detonsa TaxID=2804962 RepID=A0AA38PQ43_9AGAR|nr:hypothetical protein F5890DRAFT_1478721 [Lentinula detonsa]
MTLRKNRTPSRRALDSAKYEQREGKEEEKTTRKKPEDDGVITAKPLNSHVTKQDTMSHGSNSVNSKKDNSSQLDTGAEHDLVSMIPKTRSGLDIKKTIKEKYSVDPVFNAILQKPKCYIHAKLHHAFQLDFRINR